MVAPWFVSIQLNTDCYIGVLKKKGSTSGGVMCYEG